MAACQRQGSVPTEARGTEDLKNQGKAPASDDTVLDSMGHQELTTMMIRNLPRLASQKDLMDALNATEFEGLFDYCYLPCSFHNRRGHGYAFVNFKTSEAALAFRNKWHGTKLLWQGSGNLNVSFADIQGLEANIVIRSGAKTLRVKNPTFLPFIDPHAAKAKGLTLP